MVSNQLKDAVKVRDLKPNWSSSSILTGSFDFRHDVVSFTSDQREWHQAIGCVKGLDLISPYTNRCFDMSGNIWTSKKSGLSYFAWGLWFQVIRLFNDNRINLALWNLQPAMWTLKTGTTAPKRLKLRWWPSLLSRYSENIANHYYITLSLSIQFSLYD